MASGQSLFVHLWGLWRWNWQTGEPVFSFFFINHAWFTTSAFQARSPVKHTGGRKRQQLQTDGIQEPENGSPTITWEQLLYVYNYAHTLWKSILSSTHSWYVHSTVSVRGMKLVNVGQDEKRAACKLVLGSKHVLAPNNLVDFHHTPILEHLQLSLQQETVK